MIDDFRLLHRLCVRQLRLIRPVIAPARAGLNDVLSMTDIASRLIPRHPDLREVIP